MKVVHEWLKDYVGDTIPTPAEVEELLTFHAFEIEGVEEVGEHTVIDVDVLPNRSSDCLSHRGIAREIAALTDVSLANDPLREVPELPQLDTISVAIEDAADCPRFTGALIEGLEVGESPAWLKARLEALGQRSINNIVDATNYVMYAIGQPLHAYDADLFPQVDGQWQFAVRRAQEGETISLLPEGAATEERVVELRGDELLIVDASSNTPIGLAGVKGGSYAGVHEGTTRIIVEAAHFDPVVVRKTARRLGIVIDASKRFENEPSRELPLYAQREIATLIEQIADGTLVGVTDVYPEPYTPVSVNVSIERTNALLGVQLGADEVTSILRRLGFEIVEAAGDADVLTVLAPWERTDIQIEEDVIEEVGRVYGLEHIESVVPDAVPLPEVNPYQYYSERIRQLLLGEGFSEVITSTFRKKDKIQLQNALASDKSYVRSKLSRNLEEALERNIGHTDLLGISDVRLFEIGTVFQKGEDGVIEHMSLGLAVRTKATGFTPADEETLRAAIAAVETLLGEQEWSIEKGVAECNFSAAIAALPTPTQYEPFAGSIDVRYRPFSAYPAMTRDIALWVGDDTTAMAVEELLNEAAGELRVRTTLFDEFQKDGRTSYAFRLVFQSHEKTLTDSEVNEIMDRVYAAVDERGWEVR